MNKIKFGSIQELFKKEGYSEVFFKKAVFELNEQELSFLLKVRDTLFPVDMRTEDLESFLAILEGLYSVPASSVPARLSGNVEYALNAPSCVIVPSGGYVNILFPYFVSAATDFNLQIMLHANPAFIRASGLEPTQPYFSFEPNSLLGLSMFNPLNHDVEIHLDEVVAFALLVRNAPVSEGYVELVQPVQRKVYSHSYNWQQKLAVAEDALIPSLGLVDVKFDLKFDFPKESALVLVSFGDSAVLGGMKVYNYSHAHSNLHEGYLTATLYNPSLSTLWIRRGSLEFQLLRLDWCAVEDDLTAPQNGGGDFAF